MELRQLRVFIAVCEEGGFTAAGRRLGVVQSAVSTTVRALELDLGHTLFDRTSRRVDLTDAGRALLPEARRALDAADAARDAVDAVRGGLRGTVRIGTMHPRILLPLRLPQLLARFRAEHPGVEIQLLHGPTSAEKLRLVRDGRLDLALVGAGGAPPAGVRYLPLKHEAMQLACHRDHALATRTEVDLATLAGETFVDGPPDSASRVTNDAAFAAAGVARSIAFEINDTSGMIDMVEAGLAVAILPPSIAEGLDAVRCVPLGRPVPVLEVSLALPVNRLLGAAADDLARRILAESADHRLALLSDRGFGRSGAMRDVWKAMEDGEVVFGHWVVSGSPVIIEALGHTGADLVAIDCEHGPISPWGAELDACVRAAYAADVAPVVRVASHDGIQIAKAADLGARGVIVPHVNTPEQLAALISHARFPPHGNRGCHPSVRASRHGAVDWPSFVAESESTFTVIPLIEEPAAFERLDELLDVEGLRVVAVGSFDLAARLGAVGDPATQARVDELHARVAEGCAARGLNMLDAAWNVEGARSKVAAGCRGILFSTDVSLLVGTVRREIADVRRALAAEPS